jgi:hypothetical protein
MNPFGKVSRCGRRQVARASLFAAFAAWGVLAFVTATSLAAVHFYTLPKPEPGDTALVKAIGSLRGKTDAKRWLAVHVLYAECRCSQRILEHLATSTRPAQVREKLLLVGDAQQRTAASELLARRGVPVIGTTADTLRARFHIESAPLLLVLDPHDVVRYAGGYSQRKQGIALLDAQIIRELVAQQRPAELPLFGCAVSKELQRVLDPVSVVTPQR